MANWAPILFLLAIIVIVIVIVAIAIWLYYKNKDDNNVTTCTVNSDCKSGQICFNLQCVNTTSKPVIINNNPRHIAIPGQIYTYTVIAIGSPQPTVTWNINPNTWLTVNGDTISGIPTASNVGTTQVTCTAKNSQGSTSLSFNIVVTNATIPLEITSTPINFSVKDRPYVYEVQAISSSGSLNYEFYLLNNGSNDPLPDTLQVSNNIIYGTLDSSVQLVVDVDDGTTTVSQTWNIIVTDTDLMVPTSLPVLQNAQTTLAHTSNSCSTTGNFVGGCGSYKNNAAISPCFPAYDQTAIGWVAANYSDAVIPIRIGNAWPEDKCPNTPPSSSFGNTSIPAGNSSMPSLMTWYSGFTSGTNTYFTFYRECIVQVLLPAAGNNPASTVMLTVQDYDPRTDYITIIIQGTSSTSYTAFIGKNRLPLLQ